ncbi:hypothetical protein GF376_04560, partial [Candidatus Peregrinibacteria bacterium]|nr:hypothetical protein [Candidatus Peregrinibacteria bacterium]
MKSVGIISNDIVTKNRIGDHLREFDIEYGFIHSAANFDPQAFDLFFVDLSDPSAELVISRCSSKCIAFGTP